MSATNAADRLVFGGPPIYHVLRNDTMVLVQASEAKAFLSQIASILPHIRDHIGMLTIGILAMQLVHVKGHYYKVFVEIKRIANIIGCEYNAPRVK